jgi:hypothetical protein
MLVTSVCTRPGQVDPLAIHRWWFLTSGVGVPRGRPVAGQLERERALLGIIHNGGLGRSLRTESASPRYGMLDRVTAYMAKTFPGLR